MTQTFSTSFVEEIEAHGQNNPSLGSIVSWSVREVFIPRADLAPLLAKHNLAQIVLPEIKELRALKRALDEMTKDEILRRTVNNEDRVVYVLCKALTDGEGDLVLQRKLKVTYHKTPMPGSPDRLEFSSQEAEAILRPLIVKYQESYTSSDVTSYVLLDTLKAHGAITLRPEGGMYFVPRTAGDLVRKLRAFMHDLAENGGASVAFLSAFNVIDDVDTKQDMQRHATSTIQQEMHTLLYRLGEIRDNPKRKVRPATVVSYLEEITRIGQEASLYHDLVLLDAQGIEEKLVELRAAFQELLHRKEDQVTISQDDEEPVTTLPPPAYTQPVANWFEYDIA